MEIRDKKLFFSAGLLGLVFFIVDRVLKNLALVGKINLVKNYNLALSISRGGKFGEIIFWILASIIIFLLVYLLINDVRKSHYSLFIIHYSLIIGSASNLLDRLKFGYVIDYFNFYFFYNNLADIVIWLGVVIYLVGVWYNKNNDSNK
jgi:signal peptidase II